uniref:Uncharacterized protein n=1 Tax=Plectus sambesii TaxID=2011161 RepID=A0A914WEV7_9BILA
MRRLSSWVPFALIAALLGDVIFDKSSGCFRTVPVDSSEPIVKTPTQEVATSAPTATVPVCPACNGDACSVIEVCNNVGATQWSQASPAANREEENGCINFDACVEGEDPNDPCDVRLTATANIGRLDCVAFGNGVACITGTAKGKTGDWQTTGDPLGVQNDLGISAYCRAPGDCRNIVSNNLVFDNPSWTLALQNDPAGTTYKAPDGENGIPALSSSDYMTVTRVCCGTCAVCRSANALCTDAVAVFAAANAAAELSRQLAEESPIR